MSGIVPDPGLSHAVTEQPPTVLLMGPGASDPARIDRLLTEGAIVILAPSPSAASRWMPELLAGVTEDSAARGVGPLRVDLTAHRTTWHGHELTLTEREIRILASLVSHPARVRTYEELVHDAWGDPYLGDPTTVRSAVKRLRRKLVATAARLEPVRGVGFRLVVEDDETVR